MSALGCDVYKKLPVSTYIGHPYGIVIHSKVEIGEGCTIMHNVTIGEGVPGGGVPVVGSNVFIGAGAILLGDIEIQNNVTIGAGSVVTKSFTYGSVVAGNPAKLIRVDNDHEN